MHTLIRGFPVAQGDDPWVVRILPKVHWGAHPAGLDNLFPADPRIGVMHHFLGSWKVKGGWRKRRISVGALARRASAWLHRRCGVVDASAWGGADASACDGIIEDGTVGQNIEMHQRCAISPGACASGCPASTLQAGRRRCGTLQLAVIAGGGRP